MNNVIEGKKVIRDVEMSKRDLKNYSRTVVCALI